MWRGKKLPYSIKPRPVINNSRTLNWKPKFIRHLETTYENHRRITRYWNWKGLTLVKGIVVGKIWGVVWVIIEGVSKLIIIDIVDGLGVEK